MDNELIIRAQAIEERAREAEQNLNIINEQISELEGFRGTLENFDKTNEKEMLSLLGKGVYAKTEIKERELFVNVGSDIYVKKTAGETIKVIKSQLERLNEAKTEIIARMEAYGSAFQDVLRELQNAQKAGKVEKAKKGQE